MKKYVPFIVPLALVLLLVISALFGGILTLIIFTPLLLGLAAVLSPGLPRWVMKLAALAITVLDLCWVVLAMLAFDWGGDYSRTVTIMGEELATSFQFRESLPWPIFETTTFTIGVDSLSLILILLGAVLGVFGVLCSWTSIKEREKEFYFFLLMLQTGVMGTFCALDMFLFYVFFELMIIPLYFLIGIWGSGNRVYATMKFVIYTLVGSLLMLIAIIWMAYNNPVDTYSYELMLHWVKQGSSPFLGAMLPFLGLLIAFMIKIPLFPFHTWLPDAHTEAPTAGSVILAGILLKTGTYGILRFNIPLFPDMAVAIAPLIIWLSVIAIVYGAFAAIVQKDMKRLVAYSSVSHMAFITLGIFSFNGPGLQGAIIQMVNHGISTGGLFLLVGMIYERRHTRQLADFGGLALKAPIMAALGMVMLLSSVGLPGLNGFAGEFPILIGAMQSRPIIDVAQGQGSLHAIFGMSTYSWMVAFIAATGVIWGAVYLLLMYQKTFFGKITNHENDHFVDLRVREAFMLGALAIAAVVLGLFPKLIFGPTAPYSEGLIRQVDPYLTKAPNPATLEHHDDHGAPGHASATVEAETLAVAPAH